MALLICLALMCGMFAINYLFIDLTRGINKSESERFFIFKASYNERPIRFIIGRLIKFTLSSGFFFIFWKMAVFERDTSLADISYFPLFCGSVVIYFFALIAHLKNFKPFKPED